MRASVFWSSGLEIGDSSLRERPGGDHGVRGPCVFELGPNQRLESRRGRSQRTRGSLQQVSQLSE